MVTSEERKGGSSNIRDFLRKLLWGYRVCETFLDVAGVDDKLGGGEGGALKRRDADTTLLQNGSRIMLSIVNRMSEK